MVKKRIRMAISVFFLLALMAVTFIVIFRNHEIGIIWTAILKVRLPWILGGVAMALANLVFQGVALRIPLKAFGQTITHWRSFRYVMIGTYFSAITPSSTGGQPMQLYYMASDGLGVTPSTLTLLTTNISYQITIIAYGLVMLVVRYAFVAESINLMKAFIIYGYLIAILLLVLLILILHSTPTAERVIVFVIQLLAKLRVVKNAQTAYENAGRQVSEYRESAKLLREKPQVFYKVLATTVAAVTCYNLIPFFVYKAFGLSGYSLLDLLAVQAILYVAVSYMPVPGAVGVTEKGFVSLFSIFFPASTLISAMLIFRGLNYYLTLVISGAAVIFVQLNNARIRKAAVRDAEQIERP